METDAEKIRMTDLSFHYGRRPVLDHVNATFAGHCITAVVGPSGQGKSSLLTTINRLWEEIHGARVCGKVEIRFSGGMTDICAGNYPLHQLRQKVGMVFQTPHLLPMSIFKNAAFPLKLSGEKDRQRIEEKVQTALRQVFLWDEVKNRLTDDARSLSGGQQQRLCLARALVLQPEVLLLDEPTASLDATAVGMIEDLLLTLKNRCTILMVSHYLDQIRRVADCVMELKNRQLVKVK